MSYTGWPLNIFTSASATEKPILVDSYLKHTISSMFASPARFQFCLTYGVIVQWRPLRRRSWTANKKTHHRVFSPVRGKDHHVKFVQIPPKRMLITVNVCENKDFCSGEFQKVKFSDLNFVPADILFCFLNSDSHSFFLFINYDHMFFVFYSSTACFSFL